MSPTPVWTWGFRVCHGGPVMAQEYLPRDWFYCDAPYVGGAEVYLQWHLEYAGPEQIGLLAVDVPALDDWLREREAQGFAVQRIESGPWRAQLGALRRRLAELRPRVLHINLPHPYDGIFGLAPLAAWRNGVERVVVTEHLPGVGRVGKRYWSKRLAVPTIDAAITVCARHRSLLSEEFGYAEHKVFAIPNGVPDQNPEACIWAESDPPLPAELARQESGGGPRVIQLGSLDLRKGGDLLIDAAATLISHGQALQLWFIGEGDDRAELEARVRDHGIESRVHFSGHREDIPILLRSADLVTLASRREGLPLSLLEALCQGLPLLATEVDGVGEIVIPGETGVLVAPEDAGQLAREMSFLLNDETRRRKLGHGARARYERHHTLESMCAKTFAVHRGNEVGPR